jgi:hypothetical protein
MIILSSDEFGLSSEYTKDMQRLQVLFLRLYFNQFIVVARDGVEPPTPAFSGLDSLGLNPFSVNNLIRQGGHSFVTTL